MSSVCEHGEKGGDQFCIICLRKYGDDAALGNAEAETIFEALIDSRSPADLYELRARARVWIRKHSKR